MNNETDFFIVDEASGKVLFFEDETALMKYSQLSEGSPVYTRKITQADLNVEK